MATSDRLKYDTQGHVPQWRRISQSSKLVNKQTKIMPISLKRMTDMGAKNCEGMLEVLAADMDRYGLLTVSYFVLVNLQVLGQQYSYTCNIGPVTGPIIIRDYHMGILVIARSINPRLHYQAPEL